MTSQKNAHKLLEWDKKKIYEADADWVVKIMEKKINRKNKSSKEENFYNLLDKVRIKL